MFGDPIDVERQPTTFWNRQLFAATSQNQFVKIYKINLQDAAKPIYEQEHPCESGIYQFPLFYHQDVIKRMFRFVNIADF